MPLALATFNVKNLLDPASDRDRAILPEKLGAIARTLEACDADVVGLQEVGSEELVRAVTARIRGASYGDLVLGPCDARGIRCALLARVPVLATRIHTAAALAFPSFVAGDPAPFGARIPLRRGVVQARVAAPGLGPVDVMVVHFKSPRAVAERDASGAEREEPMRWSPRARAEGDIRSLVWRLAEALHVRGLVDESLRAATAVGEPGHTIVLGDMNDGPDSPVLRTLCAFGEGALLECSALVDPAARFSHLHDGRRSQVDHILATSALFDLVASGRFLNEGLRDHGESPRAGEREAMTVDSDHAAFVARFA